MKHINILLCSFLFLIAGFSSSAQNITYSAVHNENVRDANFEILGKVGSNIIVFKNIGWKNILQVFDRDMNELSNDRLDFIPDKILQADFVTYPDQFVMIYQYKKSGVVYCDAVTMNAKGEPVSKVSTLDTTRVGMQSGNEIYNTAYSEDKTKILLYKLHERNNNDKLHVVTKIYDGSLNLLDSTRSLIPYNDRREVYGPFQITNTGTIVFTKEIKSGNRDNIGELELITNKFKSNEFRSTAINLDKKFIDGVKLKIDNLNDHYIINSFYYPQKRASNIEGILAMLVDSKTDSVKTNTITFSDSLRRVINSSSQYRNAFDNLFLQDIFVKRDGSYLLVAEVYSSQSLGNYNSWNRWDYLYGNPYYYNSYNDYYYWNSPYYRYNRYNSYNGRNSVRYNYDNVLIMSLDSSLHMEWDNVVMKKQTDDDSDSFLSFGTMNVGTEIHFLFIEKERNAQIISNHSISPYGKIYRYPTLKSRERGYQFMPRLSKQVAARQVVMPCVYRGNLCFAKVDF